MSIPALSCVFGKSPATHPSTCVRNLVIIVQTRNSQSFRDHDPTECTSDVHPRRFKHIVASSTSMGNIHTNLSAIKVKWSHVSSTSIWMSKPILQALSLLLHLQCNFRMYLTVCGQHVVSSTGVVAHALRGPAAQKHGSLHQNKYEKENLFP